MSVVEELRRAEVVADESVKPSALAHIVFRTSRPDEMKAFYITLLNARVTFENSSGCFLTYDHEHHRVVIMKIPGLAPVDPRGSGLEHYAFTYPTMGALLANYVRLKNAGIPPIWCINHGFTTSMYYRDPDNNMIETQFDNMTSEEAVAFMRSPYFAKNMVGVDFDPERLLARYLAGDPMSALSQFKAAPYAPGVPHIRPEGIPPYDADGELL